MIMNNEAAEDMEAIDEAPLEEIRDIPNDTGTDGGGEEDVMVKKTGNKTVLPVSGHLCQAASSS